MITPAYSTTATERVLPRMALDFTTASLDARVTVVRALNTATAVNSSGYIANVNANLPRFDFDPVTKVCKGLLVEEPRTNLCLYSEDLSNAAWVYNAPLAVSSANAVVAPTGLQTADILSTTNGGSFYQDVVITGTNTHTISFFVHTSSTCTNLAISAFYLASTFANFNIVVNPSTGAVISSTATNFGAQNYGNGWYRFWASKAGTSAADTFLRLQMFNNVATTNTLVMWGAGIEVGAFPTSYIPTVASSVIRNGDVATVTGANFSSWFNGPEGTFFVDADCYVTNPSPTRQTLMLNKISGANGYMSVKIPRPSSLTGLTVVDDTNTSVAELSGQAITANTAVTVVAAYKTNDFGFSDRGVSIATDNAGSPPTGIDRMTIGYDNGTIWQNGHVAQINYWPFRLTNAEIQAFSK